jgi:hypothetical protein
MRIEPESRLRSCTQRRLHSITPSRVNNVFPCFLEQVHCRLRLVFLVSWLVCVPPWDWSAHRGGLESTRL